MGAGNEEKGHGSLESSKPSSFAFTLKSEIKSEFGTNKNFAKKLAVTEGRVSQILSGEIVSPYTLDLILRCFSSLARRQTLYDSWERSFAPRPVLSFEASSDHIEQLVGEANSLKATGKARQLVQALESTLGQVADVRLRFMILEEAAATSLYLGRTANALRLIDVLQHGAGCLDEKGWIGKALYLRANAIRTMTPISQKLVLKSHEDAISYARSYSEYSTTCRLLVESLERDRALTISLLGDGKSIDESLVNSTLASLDRGISRTEDIAGRLLWLEARIRLLLAAGKTFEAEETFEEIDSIRGDETADFSAKEKISRGNYLLARGETEEAELILLAALDECLQTDNLHHRSRLESLLSKILAVRMLG